jgi:hypothetical protein
MVEMGLNEEVDKRGEAEAPAESLERIAGAYRSDEWRCTGEAINWPPPILDELHTSCAYILPFGIPIKKRCLGGFFLWFGHVTKLTNKWPSMEARRRS